MSRLLSLAAVPFLLGAAPALAQDNPDSWKDDAEAARIFASAYAVACSQAFREGFIEETERMKRFDVVVPGIDGTSPQNMVLWQFRCGQGAYNMIDVFLLGREYDGIVPVSLAAPVVKTDYESVEDGDPKLKSVEVESWGSSTMVVNANFDPKTLMLNEYAAWRGLGDASSLGAWELTDRGFILRSFDIDASYDGESEPQISLSFKN